MDNKAMREAWARSVNNKEYKPYKDETCGNTVRGKLYNVHYLVYNILRGLPPTRGFEPSGIGYKEAEEALRLRTREFRRYGSSELTSRIDELLFPFENTVTADELRELL